MTVRVAWQGAGLFDGETLRGPGWVLVEDGLITAVEDKTVTPPADATVIDLGDAFLMPGLIDIHVHLCMNASTDAIATVAGADENALLDTARAAARRALAAGITTLRDLGDRSYTVAALRAEHARTGEVGPHLLVAGPPATTPGGHCHFLGGEAEGREALRAAVRERAERGCDVVKVMASGGEITPGSVAHRSQYSRDDLEFLVDESRRWGMTTAAHAHGVAAVGDAALAGFDTIEHASFLDADGVAYDQAVIDQVAASGTVLSATFGFHPDFAALKAGYADPTRLAIRRHLHSRGVPIVVGTDAGIHPAKAHDVLPHGIEDLPELGLSTREALRSATAVAAAACGVGETKGRLAPGYDADILGVHGNPIEDLSALHRIATVIRAGTRVR